MYTSFFGFTSKPFQLTPDPEFLFLSRAHKKALTYLNYGITENVGFILITGEIGAGKTTVLRSIIKKIPQGVRLARVNNTRVNSEQLIAMICEDFGIDVAGCEKTRMLSKLSDFIIDRYSQGERSIIIIDEAQNLKPAHLEEIRMLSNLETDKSKLLQIILVGQPELNLTLSIPELEQLRQRIAINTHISPLSRIETEAYIRHRLKVAGNENSLKIEDKVFDHIYDFSNGIPRLINIVCDFALLSAFADSRKDIDQPMIQEIIKDLVNERPEVRASTMKRRKKESQDAPDNTREILTTIQSRIYGIENAIEEMQKNFEKITDIKHIVDIEASENKRKEEELHIRENSLIEKEAYLRKHEENLRFIFEQNIRKLPSKNLS